MVSPRPAGLHQAANWRQVRLCPWWAASMPKCHLMSPVLGLGAPLLLGYFSVGTLTYPIHVESSL